MAPRLVALAAAALLGAGCGGDVGRELEANNAAAAPSDRHVRSAGVSVALPRNWHTTSANDGNVTDPRTRLVIASAPIEANGSACQVANYDFAPDAVALIVVEWQEPTGTHPPRPPRFSANVLPVAPPPAAECFDGPAGTVQFSDHGRLFGAYLLAGRAAPQPLINETRQVLDTLQVERRGDASERLARNGISIDVPNGWDARLLFREPQGRDGVIFQVANFTLPVNTGFAPPRELPPGQEDPIKAMDANDALVTVTDDADGGSTAPRPLTLGDLAPIHGARVPAGHIVATRDLCFADRCVHVEVDFGGVDAPPALVRQVDQLLSSLLVAA